MPSTRPAPTVSVVVATYERRELAQRLLQCLARQTLPPSSFEVLIVDDGSKVPAKPFLEAQAWPFPLTVLEQKNAGAAAARHKGALEAKGDVLVITDDDMQVAPDYLERHLAYHQGAERHVAIGRIDPDPDIGQMPLWERWYAYQLDRLAKNATSGKVRLRGTALYTGNVSMRRADYLAVGGFDPSLKRSEDAELGVRLEKAGCRLVFANDAPVLHGSDHTSIEVWLKRAFLYGVYDSRIWNKHRELPFTSPWRFLFRINPVARPLVGAALAFPQLTRPLTRPALLATQAADKAGLTKAAFSGLAVVYTMEYFRGVRDEAGSLKGAAKAFVDYLRHRQSEPP